MRAVLDDWQGRLERHFAQLHAQRGARPLFALEHGLSQPERDELNLAVRTYIATRSPSSEHALAWIVYAAEIGYGYSGDEYWQTFEQKTPGWRINGNREWLRGRFRSFHQNLGGAAPSGPWAAHFSIICWPITHAILPCDLQRQLARILYELRHSFSAEFFESPFTLGEFIAARSWNASSRFQNLAQETQLIGQLAAALLLEGVSGTEALVFPATLKRIGEDLERQRQSREWLRGARKIAQERARIRGLALGTWASHPGGRIDEARAQVTALGIEPRLVLRPTSSERTSWQAFLEIPDLSHLLLKFPTTRDILANSRCVVAGASGSPLARGRCLHGAQRVPLTRWPRIDEVLLKFERADPQLEYLLRTECLLRPGPMWLFRIASDGLAYESRGLRVRPGERYIAVSNSGPIAVAGHTQPIEFRCEGAYGAAIHLPDGLSDDWQAALQRIGLRQSKTIEVWPAGLAAVAWDDEGHGEWLASERPCLAIRADHAIDALCVSMGNSAEHSLELSPVIPGEPIFVELPPLPIGLHTVRVSARRAPASEAEPIGDLDVVMRIREARPWSAGISAQGPLLVQIEPPAPTMEQLWEGRVEVAVHGPKSRHIKCKVSLFSNDGDGATFTQQFPRLPLPVTAESWKNAFDKHFCEVKKAQAAYDPARACEVEFDADELGAFTLRCEREFKPLRWTLRREDQGHIVRLQDDSGDATKPLVVRMPFEAPFVEEPLESASEYVVPIGGGLFVARLNDLTTAVIAPPTITRLTDLRCIPRIDGNERSLQSVLRAVEVAFLWAHAKLPGDFLSKTRRRDVLFAIMQHLFKLVCGDNWARAESAFRHNPEAMDGLKGAVSRRQEEIAVGIVLARDYVALASTARAERMKRLASLVTRFRLIPDAIDVDWAVEFALRLASDPIEAQKWAGGRFREGLVFLMDQPTLARTARFLVITIDRHLESRTKSGELYAGWDWT